MVPKSGADLASFGGAHGLPQRDGVHGRTGRECENLRQRRASPPRGDPAQHFNRDVAIGDVGDHGQNLAIGRRGVASGTADYASEDAGRGIDAARLGVCAGALVHGLFFGGIGSRASFRLKRPG